MKNNQLIIISLTLCGELVVSVIIRGSTDGSRMRVAMPVLPIGWSFGVQSRIIAMSSLLIQGRGLRRSGGGHGLWQAEKLN